MKESPRQATNATPKKPDKPRLPTAIKMLMGIGIDAEVFDVSAKLGKVNKNKPYSSFGSQYNFNHSNLTSYLWICKKINKSYEARADQAYVNLLYQSIIGKHFSSVPNWAFFPI